MSLLVTIPYRSEADVLLFHHDYWPSNQMHIIPRQEDESVVTFH